jgi:hypothetical protein
MPVFGAARDRRGSGELPLFPLRTVLFPGGALPLKVFEQRYLRLVTRCLKDDAPFGVCLLTQGDEAAGKEAKDARFASVGTLARITSCEVPDPGILRLATRGETRFQVCEHRVEADGLVVAKVRAIAPEPAVAIEQRFAPLAQLVERIASRIDPAHFATAMAYDDASWLGYRLAEVLPLPLTVKQSMLEINDAGVRLEVLQRFLAKQGLL